MTKTTKNTILKPSKNSLTESSNQIIPREASPSLVKTDNQTTNTVESFISQAIASGASVETLERLFALRVNAKAEHAKEEFVRAMGNFQNDVPIIKKTKKVLNKDKTTVRYLYAPLESIVEQIRKPLKDNELSYSWNTEKAEKQIKVICTVTHVLGHSKDSDFTIDLDTNEYMTSPQRTASSMTFAKRHTLCNVLGISTGDEDDDSLASKKEKEPQSVKSQIMFLLRELNQKIKTREEVEESIKTLTKLDLKESNYSDIKMRLEAIVEENRTI